VINLQHYYLPGELGRQSNDSWSTTTIIKYHELLDNHTPADVYFGRKQERLSVRKMIKRETLRMRRTYNLGKGGLKKQLQLVRSYLVVPEK